MTDAPSSEPGQELFKYFESIDPVFYDSFEFRLKLPELFRLQAKREIGDVLGIPPGLRQDDPEIDDLADKTFAKCQKSLKGERIADGKTKEIRCFKCWRYVLRAANSVAIDFMRKNGTPWNHEEFLESLLILNPEAHDSGRYTSIDIEVLRSFLSAHIPPDNLEMFFLRYAEGLPPREIQERFKDLSANYISVKINRAMATARRVLTPEVIDELKRKKNEQPD